VTAYPAAPSVVSRLFVVPLQIVFPPGFDSFHAPSANLSRRRTLPDRRERVRAYDRADRWPS